MKKIIQLVLIVLCTLLAAACSKKSETPAEPVTVAEEAIEVNDYQTISDMIYRADYSDAIDLATQVMERDGKSVDGLTLRGIAYAKYNKPYMAYADLLSAVQMDRNVDTLLNLGNAMRINGLCDRAISAYKDALSISPGNVEIIMNLTNAYICLDDIDNANAMIQTIFSDFPQDAVAYTNVAIIKNIMKQYPEARKAAEMAIAADPNYRPAYQALYQICVNTQDAACKQDAKKQYNILKGQIFKTKTRPRTFG